MNSRLNKRLLSKELQKFCPVPLFENKQLHQLLYVSLRFSLDCKRLILRRNFYKTCSVNHIKFKGVLGIWL